jgi:hypothetical protein
MRVPLRHALQVAVALAAASCVLPGGQQVDPLSGGQQGETTPRPMPEGRSTPERGIMPKRVTGKQEPNLLLADDGTSCAVTADRYREVQLGKYAVCAWR